MRLFLALLLLAAAGSAAAQEAKPEPSPERAASPLVTPAPRLNLRLDDAGRYTREAPREGPAAGTLPSLGADARPVPAGPISTPRPFPKDSERNER